MQDALMCVTILLICLPFIISMAHNKGKNKTKDDNGSEHGPFDQGGFSIG